LSDGQKSIFSSKCFVFVADICDIIILTAIFTLPMVDFSLLNHRFVSFVAFMAYDLSERRQSMDQMKIGRFIAECRRKENLTQMQLAEKLNITDRAVSKWETGRALPDSSIMLELCNVLNITVNDLLSGEVVTLDHYNKELEHNLLEMIRQKEAADRRLLRLEIVLGIIAVLPLIAAVAVAGVVPMEEWKGGLLVGLSLLPLLIATPFALKIEQKAGYYACQACGHRYVPQYGRVFCAMHMGRTRYMRCPQCGKMSWQKKVLNQE
jgi:transcriptional regulator with XRE-family HTH domain/DNA-directed RNA polymerase subunit RPC12/RpoP